MIAAQSIPVAAAAPRGSHDRWHPERQAESRAARDVLLRTSIKIPDSDTRHTFA
jgi:hypothetical protein